ncbi:hypothetical protein K457DRAFT_22320 [Linnemannia elongata AG-77]|uniref:Uncharacterized protein n=1 Tax=Linnemannia elongata AG-77 TaxID=1314771 RepID=A0A197JMJ2_9FUNG|nr:hypothetical protein K457DRAFT_22320 [Linnemannia elongata AG-77]
MVAKVHPLKKPFDSTFFSKTAICALSQCVQTASSVIDDMDPKADTFQDFNQFTGSRKEDQGKEQ